MLPQIHEREDFRCYLMAQGFTQITVACENEFLPYRHYSPLAEQNFAIIATWAFAYRSVFKVIDGYMCCAFFFPGRPVSFSIHAPDDRSKVTITIAELVDKLFAICQGGELSYLKLRHVYDDNLATLLAVEGYHIEQVAERDDAEYVCDIPRSLSLLGPSNKQLRQAIAGYKDDKSLTVEDLTPENVQLCEVVESYWCDEKGCENCEGYSGCEKIASTAMAMLFNSRHNGILLRKNGEPVGYVIGEILDDKWAFGHFGKCLLSNGLRYITYLYMERHLKNHTYLNLNEDMGDLKLRHFKKLMCPFELMNKNTITYTTQGEKL